MRLCINALKSEMGTYFVQLSWDGCIYFETELETAWLKVVQQRTHIQTDLKTEDFLSNAGHLVSFGPKFLLATEATCWHSGKISRPPTHTIIISSKQEPSGKKFLQNVTQFLLQSWCIQNKRPPLILFRLVKALNLLIIIQNNWLIILKACYLAISKRFVSCLTGTLMIF